MCFSIDYERRKHGKDTIQIIRKSRDNIFLSIIIYGIQSTSYVRKEYMETKKHSGTKNSLYRSSQSTHICETVYRRITYKVLSTDTTTLGRNR